MKTTLLSLKAFFTICLLCLVGGVNVMAQDTETVDFTKQGYKNQTEVSSYTGTDFNITFSKGKGSNPPKYYDKGTAIRIYSKNTITISSATKKIKEISFDYTLDNLEGNEQFKTTSGTYSIESKKWTSDSEKGITEVTLTAQNTKGNYRLKQLIVTFAVEETSVPTPTITPTTQEFSKPFTATISSVEGAKIYYTIDGSDPRTSTTRSEYNTSVEIPAATTTLKACAVKGEATSSVSSATYTFFPIYKNIADLKAVAVDGEK